MKRKIRVGSRESKLAVVQSEMIIQELKKLHPQLEIELVTMKRPEIRFLTEVWIRSEERTFVKNWSAHFWMGK